MAVWLRRRPRLRIDQLFQQAKLLAEGWVVGVSAPACSFHQVLALGDVVTVCRRRCCGMSSVRRRLAAVSTSWPRTICGAPVPVSVIAGGELDQIQFLLRHVSIQTTERYLGCKQKLRIAVNDRLGIEPDAA